MIRTLALLALLALSGCDKDAASTATTENPKFKVDTLFVYEGCTVYRFIDYSRVYFTRCTSGPSEASWTESCGKNCTRTVTNRTESQP